MHDEILCLQYLFTAVETKTRCKGSSQNAKFDFAAEGTVII